MKSGPSNCVHHALKVYIYAYVDDLLTFGKEEDIQHVVSEVDSELLLEHTRQIHNFGDIVRVRGRFLQRACESIEMYELPEYYDSILDGYNVQKANSVNAPGASTLEADDSVEPISAEAHALYRRAVGKLQWQSPVRPDISYGVEELARRLIEPTKLHERKLKHLRRYIRGTMHYRLLIRSDYTIAPT